MIFMKNLKKIIPFAAIAFFGCSASNTSEPDSDVNRSEIDGDYSSSSKGDKDSKSSADSRYSSSVKGGSENSSSSSGKSSSSNGSSSSAAPRSSAQAGVSTDKYLNPDIKYGSMTDPRDGQVYKTVRIGIQNWMAQNLNYDNPKDSTTRDSHFECGRMYTWRGANFGAVADCNENDAMNPQGICPDGWHIPTPSDWGMLFNYAKDRGITNLATAFRSKVEGSWPDDTGTDDFGFSIVFGGYGSYNGYTYVTTNNQGQHETGLWTSEHGGFFSSRYALTISIEPGRMGMYWFFDDIGNFVRCLENYDIDSLAQHTPDAGSKYDSKAHTLTDLRDNEVYKTTQIGDRVWMAENLRYVSKGGFADADVHSKCRTKDSCFVGRYYTWAAAMDTAYSLYKYKTKAPHRGICPSGWHIPTDAEYDTLFKYVGGIENAGTVLKDSVTWRGGKNTDRYGFNMKAYDSYTDCEFRSVGYDANLWTADNRDSVGNVVYFSSSKTAAIHSYARKQAYLQVRCLMDEPVDPIEFNDFGTFTDTRDKQVYRTTKIGEDTWMADNLNYKPHANEASYFGSVCPNDVDSNCEIYGLLYEWDVATLKGTEQGICPDGWHVSTKDDWNALIQTVNDAFTIGEKLKASNLWKDIYFPQNPYGFSALPAGYSYGNSYDDVGTSAQFWLAEEVNDTVGAYYEIVYNNKSIAKYTSGKKYKRSVRCVKNR